MITYLEWVAAIDGTLGGIALLSRLLFALFVA